MSHTREEFIEWAELRKLKFSEQSITDAAKKLAKVMQELEADILLAEAMGENVPAERKMLLERIMDAIERVDMLEEVEKRGTV